MRRQLDSAQKLKSKLKSGPAIPESLHEKISEISVLQKSLPKGLSDLEKYLKNARVVRENLNSKFKKLDREFSSLRKEIDLPCSGLDFDSLERRRDTFDEVKTKISDIDDEINKLETIVNQILDSLKPEDKVALSIKFSEYQEQLNDALKSYKVNEEIIRSALEKWKRYRELIRKIKDVLSKSAAVFDQVPSSLDDVKPLLESIHKMKTECVDNQKCIDEIVGISNDICEKSNDKWKNDIQNEVSELSTSWQSHVERIGSNGTRLERLAEAWRQFTTDVDMLNANLTTFETKLQDIENGANALLQLPDVLQQLTVSHLCSILCVLICFSSLDQLPSYLNISFMGVKHAECFI